MPEPRIIYCPNNHIYDAAIYSSCPYCKKISYELKELSDSVSARSDVRHGYERLVSEEDYTELIPRGEETVRTERLHTDSSEDPDDDTELIHNEETDNEDQGNLVGWFVIKEGLKKGHSIELFENTGFLSITADRGIVTSMTENTQTVASVKWTGSFGIAPTNASIFMVNGKNSETEVFLHSYDVITIDSFQLVYVELMTQFLGWGDK